MPCAFDFCFKEKISNPGNSLLGIFSVFVSLMLHISNFETYSGKILNFNLLVKPQTFNVEKDILENVGFLLKLTISELFAFLNLPMPNRARHIWG